MRWARLSALVVAVTAASILVVQPAVAASKVVVFAASSLTESFTKVGTQFQKENPAIQIVFSFQASSTLETQLSAGAYADIFASAESIPNGKDYLKNRVVLAVSVNSSIRKMSDLNGTYKWIQCSHEVPCGKVTDVALASENIRTKPISLEPRVSSAVAKLAMGEVDAAFVYMTDVKANSGFRAIEFKNRSAATTTYQIVQLHQNKTAKKFSDYLQSLAAKRVLRAAGFQIL